jgi:hypothetical protein
MWAGSSVLTTVFLVMVSSIDDHESAVSGYGLAATVRTCNNAVVLMG